MFDTFNKSLFLRNPVWWESYEHEDLSCDHWNVKYRYWKTRGGSRNIYEGGDRLESFNYDILLSPIHMPLTFILTKNLLLTNFKSLKAKLLLTFGRWRDGG